MAIAFLNHTTVGKATHAAYTAAAHIRYITRRSATNYVYSERMPVQYHAAQRFMVEREDRIRKNGRVCDKFIIALPREMTMEQGVDALRDFGFRLSRGQAPFLFSIQDFNSENPHAHFCYIDESVVDKSRVFRTTDRDSTERIKKVWAETCNEHLLELGRSERIEFGKPQEVETTEVIAENDNLPSDPTVDVQEAVGELPAPESTPIQTAPEMDDDLPLPETEEDSDVAYVDYGAKERHERIKVALLARQERDFLKAERDELTRLEEAVRKAERDALDKHTNFNIASFTAAKAEVGVIDARRQVERGAKGFHIKLGRFEWKTEARKAHEKAVGNLGAAAYLHQLAKQRAIEENAAAASAARAALDIEQKRHAVEAHLRTRGTTEELIEAEQIFENTTAANLMGISVEDVFAELEAGNLTNEEAKKALEVMGHEDSWTLHEEMDGGIEQ